MLTSETTLKHHTFMLDILHSETLNAIKCVLHDLKCHHSDYCPHSETDVRNTMTDISRVGFQPVRHRLELTHTPLNRPSPCRISHQLLWDAGSNRVSRDWRSVTLHTTGRATYFAREYSDCRLLPLHCVSLQNMTFKLRRYLLGIY